jgi:hypothetical protein
MSGRAASGREGRGGEGRGVAEGSEDEKPQIDVNAKEINCWNAHSPGSHSFVQDVPSDDEAEPSSHALQTWRPASGCTRPGEQRSQSGPSASETRPRVQLLQAPSVRLKPRPGPQVTVGLGVGEGVGRLVGSGVGCGVGCGVGSEDGCGVGLP